MSQAPDPGPDFSDLYLLAKGGWRRGGRVHLFDQARGAGREEELAPTLFAVLALLVLRCRQDAAAPAPDLPPGWRPGGFVSKAALGRKLTEALGVWDPDLPRFVLRLRQFFARLVQSLRRGPHGARAARRDGTPPAWTKRLIENSPSQGYRLNLPAENLQLFLDEDEP